MPRATRNTRQPTEATDAGAAAEAPAGAEVAPTKGKSNRRRVYKPFAGMSSFAKALTGASLRDGAVQTLTDLGDHAVSRFASSAAILKGKRKTIGRQHMRGAVHNVVSDPEIYAGVSSYAESHTQQYADAIAARKTAKDTQDA